MFSRKPKGDAWWKCPKCSAGETGLPDEMTAYDRANNHFRTAHPGQLYWLKRAFGSTR